ncbi:BTB/POZ domain-containing protein KCTD19 [Tiliqua scincoides]|uniref:BTB/POZ domain-containing protein KCTD19 n=1 Tax=Tiliqua scincoides TaxID=71010 RepID=UPI0034633621
MVAPPASCVDSLGRWACRLWEGERAPARPSGKRLGHFGPLPGDRPRAWPLSGPGASMEEPEAAAAAREACEGPLVHLNVGGWRFSVPRSKLAQFPESLLWREVAAEAEEARLFLDRDGCTFRHVHYYLHTARLSFSSCAELHLLHEQALLLRLTPLLQTLDNLKEGKHNLRVRPADIPISERASMNYWRTRKCISKPSEFPLKNPAFTGLHEKAPLGLMDTPLLDTEEEVHYCFLPLDLVEKYPSLVNDDNLLWLSDNAVLIECEGSEFRFIANFLRSEKILLPDNFSSMDVLEAEADGLGIPELAEAVKLYRSNPGGSVQSTKKKQQDPQEAGSLSLYPMVFGLLVKYPDSALGQLHMESTLDGNKLYISGNGVLFQHVMNWLGTCRLPLIRNMSELPELCAYLDQMDIIYEPMKDALKIYLKQKTPTAATGMDADWAAEVKVFSHHHIVKVYVGCHWYATYLQTLLKFPELLSNCRKTYWIAYGQSLLIHGDGQIFRHILNFLRLGKLFLPSEFKEWPLLCQEVLEYQIPSLIEALYQYDTYRSWVKQQETPSNDFPCGNLEKEQGSTGDPQDHSYLAVDLNQCANNWRTVRDAQDVEDNDQGTERYTRISPNKGTKRRNNWEGYTHSIDGWGNCKQPESPPRKRGARGNVTKKAESRDTPIQKLISLVQGWDMVNCKRYEVQQVPGSAGIRAEEDPKRKPSCSLPPALGLGGSSLQQAGNGIVIHTAPGIQGEVPKAGECPLGTPASDGRLAKTGGSSTPKDIRLSKESIAVKERSDQGKERQGGAIPEQTTAVVDGSIGLILKVEHPPVVACDGSCVSHEDSVLYYVHREDVKLAGMCTSPATKDVVFLSFPLSQEEIFYARKCHCFLTDVILESIRQKDPKEMTAKVELLVQKLWRLQITAKEFVADLLNAAPFKADSHVCEKLLKWVEFTLPFAWKYSGCIDLLIQKGYFKSLSHFVIGKYLHKS